MGSTRAWALNHEDFIKLRSSVIPYLRFSTSDPGEIKAVKGKMMRVERANIHIDKARLYELRDEADKSYEAFRMITLERRKEYERALEINPDDESVPVFFADGRDVVVALEKWTQSGAANAQAQFELGSAYLGQRMYPEAIAALTRATELDSLNDRYRSVLEQAQAESK